MNTDRKATQDTEQHTKVFNNKFWEHRNVTDFGLWSDALLESGGFLTKAKSDTPYDIWYYQDQERQIQYEFSVYEGSVTVVNEIVISENSSQ